MPGLPTHLVQELNGGTVHVNALKATNGRTISAFNCVIPFLNRDYCYYHYH